MHAKSAPAVFSNRRRNAITTNTYVLQQRNFEDTGECDSLVADVSSIDISDLAQLFLPESETHDCGKHSCDRVTLNISGLIFQTQIRTLERLPETLLGNDEKRKKYWDASKDEYFFDRHRPSFPAILYFYQSGGRLLRPIEVPPDIFLEEIKFFEMGSSVIRSYMEAEGLLQRKVTQITNETSLRERIWNVLENSHTSLGAKLFSGFSIVVIVVSVASFCIETLPQYRNIGCINVTTVDSIGRKSEKIVPNFGNPLSIIESVCILWFVVEFVLRFIFCPSKLVFMKSLINWIDVAAILPYFIYLFVYFATGKCFHDKSTWTILRILRVTRALKLSKHFDGLRILGRTFKQSMAELFLFGVWFVIGVILFSCAMFYAEQSVNNTQFTSIPATFWWAVVTMTTVGYGDMYPEGVVGKIIGIFPLLFGMISFALPLPVIIENFNNLYQSANKNRALERRKE